VDRSVDEDDYSSSALTPRLADTGLTAALAPAQLLAPKHRSKRCQVLTLPLTSSHIPCTSLLQLLCSRLSLPFFETISSPGSSLNISSLVVSSSSHHFPNAVLLLVAALRRGPRLTRQVQLRALRPVCHLISLAHDSISSSLTLWPPCSVVCVWCSANGVQAEGAAGDAVALSRVCSECVEDLRDTLQRKGLLDSNTGLYLQAVNFHHSFHIFFVFPK